jgi:hypothetical protein
VRDLVPSAEYCLQSLTDLVPSVTDLVPSARYCLQYFALGTHGISPGFHFTQYLLAFRAFYTKLTQQAKNNFRKF